MRKIIFLLLASFALPSARAFAQSLSKPTIIFFGGWHATQADMDIWEAGYKNSAVGQQYQFIGVPYPSVSPNSADVIRDGQKQIQFYASYIIAHPNDQFLLVGHSSGGVLPTEVAKRLPTSAKVKLFIFDGSNLASAMQKVFPTTCYSGINFMSACSDMITFHAPTCLPSSRWCLHFRMVNANAAYNLVSVDAGYDHFVPYLDWLPKY